MSAVRRDEKSNLGLLCYLQSIINLDSKISDSALQFGMTQQKLHSPEILRAAIYQSRLRSAQRMGAVLAAIQADQ